MEYDKHTPELSAPPPETGLPPELPVLPPEFGQGSGSQPEAPKKRRLRQLLLIPALLLSVFLLFHGTKAPASIPTERTEPTDPFPMESSKPDAPASSGETEPAPSNEPAAPSLSGSLEIDPDGRGEAEFRFVPDPGDPRDYDLRVVLMGQQAYWEDESIGFSLVDDPASVPVTGDRENGYSVRYSGGTAAAMIPLSSQLSLYVVLEDQHSGKRWTIETNRVDAVAPEPEVETWPLAEGTLTITVYNDTTTYEFPSLVDAGDYQTLLAMETMPEAEFTDYVLPSPLIPEGYEFAGWVIHVNNPMDLSAEGNLFAEYNGDPPPEALLEGGFAFPVQGTLTREDVERVPPSEDGVRYVNVHAVWISAEPERELLFLDDGDGNVSAYGMELPMASEGYLYLCNYPVPEREGLVFEGWYDDSGNKVELLVCYFSFVPILENEDGSFGGYDWGSLVPVHLTAHWRPA